MRAATLVHFLVIALFFLAVFLRTIKCLKIDKKSLKNLSDSFSSDKIKALKNISDKEFTEKKLLNELEKLKFDSNEIKIILENVTEEKKISYKSPYLAPFIIIFTCWLYLSTCFSVCLRPSVEELVRITDYMILTWIMAAFFDKKSAFYILITIFTTGSIVSCLGILFLLLPGVEEFRAYSTFYQSDAFAGYLLLVIPLIICLSCGNFSFWPRVSFMVLGVIFISSLYLTQSRGGWLCFIITLLVIIWGMRKKEPLLVVFKTVFFVVFSFIFVFFLPAGGDLSTPVTEITQKATTVGNLLHSSFARLHFWIGGVKIALAYPVTGIGLGNFGRLYPQFQEEIYYFSHYAHNYYAQMAAETGIVGFIFFMLLVFAILFIGFKLLFRGDLECQESSTPSNFISDLAFKNTYVISTGLFCGLLASMMHSFIDVDWNFPAIPHLFWVEAGLLCVFAESVVNLKPLKLFGDNRFLLNFAKIFTGLFLLFTLFLYYCFWQGEIFEDKAKALQEANRERDSFVYMEEASRWDPMNAEYHRGIGKLAFGFYKTDNKVDYLDFAIAKLEQAVYLDPYKAAVHSDLGYYYLEKYYMNEKKYLDKAREQLELSLKNDPVNYPQFYTTLGQIYIYEGKNKEAEETFLAGARVIDKPENLDLLWDFRRDSLRNQLIVTNLALGDLYFAENKMELSKEYYNKVIAFDPDSFEANYGLGVIALGENEVEEAKDYMVKASHARKDADAFYLAGLCYITQGYYDKGIEYMKMSLEVYQEFVPALIELGRIYDIKGEREHGIELWERALELEPDNETVKELLGHETVPENN